MSVCIVSTDGREDLLRCLDSVFRHPPSGAFEVLVVDNASTDGTADAVRARFGEAIELIALSERRGKAENDSALMSRARGRWCLLLNEDSELTPGAARVGNYKAVFNLRGDDGAATGGLAVDTNLGWKGAEKYTATVPQVFDLWQDPQERYDIFMNNYTERTWTIVTINEAIRDKMKTYIEYPPRKLQSEVYTGPITLSQYQRFQWVREQLEKDGVRIPLPTGN